MNKHLSGIILRSKEYPRTDQYPFSLPLFHTTGELNFDSPVSIFTGENGTGKSTLLEAMARACGIHIWSRDEGQHYKTNRYEKRLHKYISVKWSKGSVPGAYFGSESFNDFRKIVDGWAASDPGQLKYFGGESLLTQSHGQSIMSYFESRYKIKGIYFLDEPETALSPKTQLKLLKIIQENIKKGHAQFFIATHSPILMAVQNARIFSFDGDLVQHIGYKETEHYKIYKDFLNEI